MSQRRDLHWTQGPGIKQCISIVVLLGRIPWPRGAKGLFLAPTIPNNLGWGAWQFRGPKSVPWDWMIYLEDHPRTDASGDGNLH